MKEVLLPDIIRNNFDINKFGGHFFFLFSKLKERKTKKKKFVFQKEKQNEKGMRKKETIKRNFAIFETTNNCKHKTTPKKNNFLKKRNKINVKQLNSI